MKIVSSRSIFRLKRTLNLNDTFLIQSFFTLEWKSNSQLMITLHCDLDNVKQQVIMNVYVIFAPQNEFRRFKKDICCLRHRFRAGWYCIYEKK